MPRHITEAEFRFSLLEHLKTIGDELKKIKEELSKISKGAYR